MISILIPVYRYDVQNLVRQIDAQIQSTGWAVELILLDDGSGMKWEALKEEFPQYSFLSNSLNRGRSFCRNRLVELARYENVIFLDCDVQLWDRPEWLQTYAQLLMSEGPAVYYGSCLYPDEKPQDPRLLLHWKYGRLKENPSLEYRKKHAVACFHTVNFATKRALCLVQPFEEQLNRYGHEDSLWALKISELGIPIIHIQNPVLHLGINNHRQFLRNTASSIKNLLSLKRNGINMPSKLLRAYLLLDRIHLSAMLFRLYRFVERHIVHNLLGNDPKLSFLAIYKMGLIIRFSRNMRNS